MKIKNVLLVFVVSLFFVVVQAKSGCQGWQVRESEDGIISEHFHDYRCVQTIQITNNGNIYFLIAGPYGFDQFVLNSILPKRFPYSYIGKCCWLRKTKDGKKLVMSYTIQEPESLLL